MPNYQPLPQIVEPTPAPAPARGRRQKAARATPETPARRGQSGFAALARSAARLTGRPGTFAAALLFIVVWAVSGPLFHWSDTWQLVVNTSTTIITFLMIFLLQSSQNRDAEAVQLKLDELIRAIDQARNSMLDVEEMDDEERARMKRDYEALSGRAAPPAAPKPAR